MKSILMGRYPLPNLPPGGKELKATVNTAITFAADTLTFTFYYLYR